MQAINVESLVGPSLAINGCEVSEPEAWAMATARFSGRMITLVREWIWIDFDAPTLVDTALAEQGQQPVMLLGFTVPYSDTGRSEEGGWVRSTPLVTFSENMFFETTHCVYVLIGPGRRKRMNLSTVIRLF